MNADKAYERWKLAPRALSLAASLRRVDAGQWVGPSLTANRWVVVVREISGRSRKERLQRLRRPERNHDLLYAIREPIDARRYVE